MRLPWNFHVREKEREFVFSIKSSGMNQKKKDRGRSRQQGMPLVEKEIQTKEGKKECCELLS